MVVGVAGVEAAGQIRIVRQRQPEEMRLRRDFGDRDFQAGRAFDADLAVAKFQIVRPGFEHVACDALELLLDDLGGAGHGACDHHRVAAAARPGAREPVVGIRISHADVGRVHAELLGQHHGGDRLRAVAPARRMQRDHRLAGRVDLDRGAFRRTGQRKSGRAVEHPELGGAEHALLLAARDADADIASLRAHELLLVAPAAVVEHLQRHVEGAGIIAAVVKIAGRDLIGKLVRLDEIVAPERGSDRD